MSESIETLEKNLQGDPQNWHARLALIEAHLQEENQDKAIEVLGHAESLPGDDEGLIAAARCYVLVGATDQAKEICDYALQVNPDNRDAQAYLAAIASHEAEGDDATGEEIAAEVDEEHDAAVAAEEDVPVAKAVPVPDADADKVTSQPTANLLQARPDADGMAAPAPVVVREVDAESFDADAASELERIHAEAEESLRRREAMVRRDKFNSITVTILVHVAIVLALTLVATKVPRNVPPQIVASAQQSQDADNIQNETMTRPTQTSSASSSAMADIVSVNSMSAFSVSEVAVDSLSNMGFADTGIDMAPSMDLGVETSGESKMMFGQKMEGDVLGVVLDVSGSMAEYLPHVVREVDKNFKDAPIVYARDMVVRKRTRQPDVRLIIPDEVRPRDEEGNRTPFWFLWHDLPKKAPQRYVDRVIDTMKTRPNQFIAIRSGGADYLSSAIDFLVEQKIDSLYIFSDFEDFVDEDLALEIGQNLGRRRIRTYVQPAEKKTEGLDIMTKKIVNRTRGRQMPTLVSIFDPGDDEPAPLTLQDPEDPLKDSPFTYANPREEMIGKEFYHRAANRHWWYKNQVEVGRISEPGYEAVFYGPQAQALIFMKNDEGQFIQNPIWFHYWSWYRDPERVKDPAYHGRRRKFLRVQEEPTFDEDEGEIVWKMVMEGELEFNVHLFLWRGGMNATYTAEPPTDGTSDGAHISFGVPGLAYERNDTYYGQDLPSEGLKVLDDVRKGAHPNTVVFNLPRQDRDRYRSTWELDGFEPGYNTRHFDQLIRRMPHGVRSMEIKGPSFATRTILIRTTSSKKLINGWSGRHDIEPWEGFGGSLHRSGDTRTRFTKTEAIEIEIQ